MTRRAPCVILGSGNIGSDLLAKLLRSEVLEPVAMVGIDPASDGLERARTLGVAGSAEGADWILQRADEFALVFDATSADAHRAIARRFAEAGLQSVDLTPAKLGPGVVPVVNLETHWSASDVNMVTCGGQATIPMVAAVAAVAPVAYAEIVATIASLSAGPGTRVSIDSFTRTTARGLEEIGGAERGKAIIVLNPADPPLMMANTIYLTVPEEVDEDAIREAILQMRERVAEYVPGYRLRADPVFDPGRITIFIEVEGAGDYLPAYAGNLDIMTAAAVRVGEELARMRDAERALA
jgi:acetaldehyde dehydrogenase